MKLFILGPDGGNFCQFMKQNFPTTYVFGPFQPGVSRDVDFLSFPNSHIIFCINTKHILKYFRPIQDPDGAPLEGPSRAQMERPWRAHPRPRWSAHGRPIQGPRRPKVDQMEAEGRPNGGLGAKPPEKNHIEKNQGGPRRVAHMGFFSVRSQHHCLRLPGALGPGPCRGAPSGP